MADTTYLILRRLSAAREHRQQEQPEHKHALSIPEPGGTIPGSLGDVLSGTPVVEAWTPIGTIDASSGLVAMRAFAEHDTELEEGDHDLRAVPARSWSDETYPVTVATRRTVTPRRVRDEARVPA